MKMDVATGVSVECADGPCGRSQYVILNPANATITHVVVGETDMFARTRLVPLTYVVDGAPELIRLKCTRTELQALPLFSEYEMIPPEGPYLAHSPSEFWMGPLAAHWPALHPTELQHVPKGEMPIRRGARVEAFDGHVGKVNEFVVEPGSGHITHLVLREGHLWGHRDVVIPASEIDRIEQDAVYLKLSKERVGALPPLSSESKEGAMEGISTPRAAGSQANATSDPRAIRALAAELSSSDRTTREDARLALVQIGAPAVEVLAAALTSPDTQLRWEAAKALQQINDPAGALALVSALEDSDPGVRWIGAEGLSLLGLAGVIPLLKALTIRSDSPWLLNGAHHVLRALADPELKKTVAPVLAALEDIEPVLEVPVVAHEALIALGAAS
jgi:sporulation protein YlmC with PRC-barrel domain